MRKCLFSNLKYLPQDSSQKNILSLLLVKHRFSLTFSFSVFLTLKQEEGWYGILSQGLVGQKRTKLSLIKKKSGPPGGICTHHCQGQVLVTWGNDADIQCQQHLHFFAWGIFLASKDQLAIGMVDQKNQQLTLLNQSCTKEQVWLDEYPHSLPPQGG